MGQRLPDTWLGNGSPSATEWRLSHAEMKVSAHSDCAVTGNLVHGIIICVPCTCHGHLPSLLKDGLRYPRSPALTAAVVVHAGLGKHGVVLHLRLAHGGAVVADDHQLDCSVGGMER